MEKHQILNLIKLLSAIESAFLISKITIPDYLHDNLDTSLNELTKELLDSPPKTSVKEEEEAKATTQTQIEVEAKRKAMGEHACNQIKNEFLKLEKTSPGFLQLEAQMGNDFGLRLVGDASNIIHPHNNNGT